jgi:hypothetical protein
MTRAIGVPLYQIFYDGEKPPAKHSPEFDDGGWGSSGRDAQTLGRFRRLLKQTREADRRLLFSVAQKMAGKKIRTNR